MEYRMDNVIVALSSDDPVKVFSNDQSLYWGLMYYCTNETENLITKINAELQNGNKKILLGIIEFFPITSKIIEKLVVDDDTNAAFAGIIDRCDFADVLAYVFRKFTNIIDDDVKKMSDGISEINETIEEYKSEITKHQNKIDNYKKNMENEKELHDQLIAKQNELHALEAEWGEEMIREKICKAEDEIKKKNEEKLRAEAKLKDLGKKLGETENCSDTTFIELVQNFNEIIHNLPKDVSES